MLDGQFVLHAAAPVSTRALSGRSSGVLVFACLISGIQLCSVQPAFSLPLLIVYKLEITLLLNEERKTQTGTNTSGQ